MLLSHGHSRRRIDRRVPLAARTSASWLARRSPSQRSWRRGLVARLAQDASASAPPWPARTAAPTRSSCWPTSRPASRIQQALADEFTKQFPNVTWNIREDQFTNLMHADAAPAVRRQPAGPHPPAHDGRPRPDGLLLDLEPYVAAYGWDQWPAVAARRRIAWPRAADRVARVTCTPAASTTARPACSTTRSRPRRSA